MSDQLFLFGPPEDDASRQARATSDALEARREHAATLAAALPPEVAFGCSSWAFPGWAGLVYPPGLSPAALSRVWGVPVGLAGGVFSALFGTGGVLFAIYNAGRIRDKDALRATNAAMIMLSSLVRVVLFAAAGLLTQDGLLATALLLVPALAGGVWLGNRLHAAVPAAAVVKAVYALLVLAGLTLLARSL